MNSHHPFCLVASLLVLGAACIQLVAEQRNAPATVVNKAGKQLDDIYVAKYHYDELIYALDPRDDQFQSMSGDQIRSVRFGKADSAAYLRATGYLKAGNYASAVTYFMKAAKEADWEWERVDAFLQAAEAHRRQRQYDQALQTIDQLLQEYSKTARLADAYFLRCEVFQDQEQWDRALKVLDELERIVPKMSERLGLLAQARIARGRGAVYAATGEPAKAIGPYEAIFRQLSVADFPEEYGEVGLALGQAQAAAGRAGAALETLGGLIYQAIPAAQQGRAHLAMARIYDEQGRSVQAVDSAVFAYLRGGNDPAVSAPARELAIRLCQQLGKDGNLDPVDQKEYRTYANRL